MGQVTGSLFRAARFPHPQPLPEGRGLAHPPARPLAGLRGAILGAACILGGALILVQSDAWLLGGGLVRAGFWCYGRGG